MENYSHILATANMVHQEIMYRRMYVIDYNISKVLKVISLAAGGNKTGGILLL